MYILGYGNDKIFNQFRERNGLYTSLMQKHRIGTTIRIIIR